MTETDVTELWMAGVVAAMLVFGLMALCGYAWRRVQDKQEAQSPLSEESADQRAR